MKNRLIVVVIVGSILGLILVQYHFLKAGLLLEKRKFDWKVEQSLDMVSRLIDQDSLLRESLLLLHPDSSGQADGPAGELPVALRDALSGLFNQTLQKQDLNPRYDFAVTTGNAREVLVASANYYQKAFAFERYRKQLRGKIYADCRCELYLYFQVDHLFNYLLSRLAYMVIPSVLAILLLIACLLILIRNLNNQRRLDRVKNDFINNLTHELKTPVFSISLIAKVLREAVNDGKNERSLEYISLLEKENEVMKGQIDKVLELASLESGRYELKREAVDMHALIRDLIGQYTLKVRDRKGLIIQHLHAAKKELAADMQHLRNAIQNLLENAIKYNEGEPRITIDTIDEPDHFVLSISDNGIGIKPEDQRRIFDKFYRVSTGDLHKVQGFGLGLSYVKRIIEAHGGTISVSSKPGEGSRFRIVLPFT